MPVNVTVQLMGGLGNQMFQYAAARGLALRNGSQVRLDTRTGFARDHVYRRKFELGVFPIHAQKASRSQSMPFLLEAARAKILGQAKSSISRRAYGTWLRETRVEYLPDVAMHHTQHNVWMHGYWQSEQYFSDIAAAIAAELSPPAPDAPHFSRYGDKMADVESVAVGVRLFEEVPGGSKAGVGGLTPVTFFNAAARLLAARVNNPVFFVFSTRNAPELKKIDLPGPVHFVTHDNGFNGSVARLWLLTRARHHIIANSSFYWWGAWLAEAAQSQATIIASELFPNSDTVPSRWTSIQQREAKDEYR